MLSMPGMTPVDFGDPEIAVGGLDVRAQQAAVEALDRWLVARIHVVVAGVQLARDLTEDVVEVGSVGDVVDQRQVLVVDRLPVVAVHAGLVEPVPHDAPLVGVHLAPFDGGLDAQLHAREIQVALAGVLVRFGFRNAEMTVFAE